MEEELKRCQIQEWYPQFKSHSIKTLFHPLPDSFVRYLLGKHINPTSNDDDESNDEVDGNCNADNDTTVSQPLFLLPKTISGRDPLPRTNASQHDPISSLSLLDSESDEDENNDDQPSFPDLESGIEQSITALGGAVFPKLNWSAPKDATWISCDGTLRCSSFSDIALLLKSSDSIAHDLSHSALSSFVLALRKYYPSLRPEMEFRCFVRNKDLAAISQREVTSFYPVIVDRKHELQLLIAEFFYKVVRPKFESDSYTFDVYITSDSRVKLLDFNPWGEFTLPLLFSWEELENDSFGEEGVNFRIVESRMAVRPGLKTAVPYDYIDMGEGSGWDQFFKKAEAELRRQHV